VVEKVVQDPERDAYIDVIVKPAAHLDRLDEVLVITSTEPRFSSDQQKDLATSEAEKGPEAAAIRDQQIKDQQKASQIMAERLPGLIDPNLPADQQPLMDTSNPNPVAHPPQALHPDRFTPGAGAGSESAPATPIPDGAGPSPTSAKAEPKSGQAKSGQAKATKPPAKAEGNQ
jgi:rod shape-determining protein MreC